MADMGCITGKVTLENRTFLGFLLLCDNCEKIKLLARFRVVTGTCAYGGEVVGWIACTRCALTWGRLGRR
jgi:hypothetical protein